MSLVGLCSSKFSRLVSLLDSRANIGIENSSFYLVGVGNDCLKVVEMQHGQFCNINYWA